MARRTSSATPVAPIVLPGWVNGLNRDADPYQLGVDESPDALNVDFGLRGSVSKRRGYTAWDVAGPSGNARKFVVWNILGGAERMFYVDNDGTIFYGSTSPLVTSSGGVGTWSTAIQYHVGVASLNDVIYFTALNATAPRSFDGTSWASVTASDLDGTSSRFPKAAQVVTHQDRIFAGNVATSGGTRYSSRVHWSDALDAETWVASNYIDFDPDDGDEITCLAPLGESLLVFKKKSIHLLTGKSEDSFSRYRIDSQLGTTAPGSVVAYSGAVFFFDPSSGVWLFDGSSFQPQDATINKYILSGINSSYAYKSYAYIYQGSLYLSVPWGSDTYPSRTFVKNLITGAWTEYDYGVHGAAIFGGVIYGAAVRNTAGVYGLHSGVHDANTAIDAYFRTAWLTPVGAPLTKYRLRRLDTVWTGVGNYTPTVTMYRDFQTSSELYSQSIDTDPGGALFGTAVFGTDVFGASLAEIMSRTTGWGNARWNAVQFKVGTDSASDDWELNRMSLVLSSLSRVRGEA
jgi:hypothetical protein